MSNYWKKIDGIEKQSISNFQTDDECFYAHDFLSSRGFQGGSTNNNVLNFKKAPVTASHIGGSRTPATIASSYTFQGFTGNMPEFILVFDDVLTTGAHFRAFKDFLIQSGYTGKVYGLFWAKTK